MESIKVGAVKSAFQAPCEGAADEGDAGSEREGEERSNHQTLLVIDLKKNRAPRVASLRLTSAFITFTNISS